MAQILLIADELNKQHQIFFKTSAGLALLSESKGCSWACRVCTQSAVDLYAGAEQLRRRMEACNTKELQEEKTFPKALPPKLVCLRGLWAMPLLCFKLPIWLSLLRNVRMPNIVNFLIIYRKSICLALSSSLVSHAVAHRWCVTEVVLLMSSLFCTAADSSPIPMAPPLCLCRHLW